MKKTLIAAALLAGFAGVAQAETSVTLYGLIDTGIGYNKFSGDGSKAAGINESRFGMINGTQNGSRWGLRGTEDLGEGLQAVFKLESGFNSADGRSAQGSRLFGRQATVGLSSSSWGLIELGRQTNIASKYLGDIDVFGAGFGQANIGYSYSAANTARYDNMIMYQSPSFSGFSVGAGYSFAVNNATSNFQTSDNTRAVTAGVKYDNGPLKVALTFDQLNGDKAQRASDDVNPRSYGIGASYDFNVVRLALAYARTTDGWFAGETSYLGTGFPQNDFNDGLRANSYSVGLSAPLGDSSKVFASWQRVTFNSGYGENTNVYSLGYTFDLSKRTNLYSYGSYGKHFGGDKDVNSTAVGVGVRHRF